MASTESSLFLPAKACDCIEGSLLCCSVPSIYHALINQLGLTCTHSTYTHTHGTYKFKRVKPTNTQMYMHMHMHMHMHTYMHINTHTRTHLDDFIWLLCPHLLQRKSECLCGTLCENTRLYGLVIIIYIMCMI